ncbi:MAG: hypothetical protein ABL982_26355 [Vicinamibacterales bacterium]
MSTITNAKAYRVTFEVRQGHYVDVLAVADWQAIEFVRALFESDCGAVECLPPDADDVGGWATMPLTIGGAS